MTPTHSRKSTKRYRYYISRSPIADAHEPLWRISATDIEKLVAEQVHLFLSSQSRIHALIQPPQRTAEVLQRVLRRADMAAATIRSGVAIERAKLLRALVDKVVLFEQRLAFAIKSHSISDLLGLEPAMVEPETTTLTCNVDRVRKGHAIRLVIPANDAPAEPSSRNEKLVSLIREAHQTAQLLSDNPDRALSVLAAEHGKCRTHMARLISLTCLAPDIVAAIFVGTQPASLRKTDLLNPDLPICWNTQRAALGFTT